jgi:hypothetical protein
MERVPWNKSNVTSLTINGVHRVWDVLGEKGSAGTAIANNVTVFNARLFTLSQTALPTRTIFIKDF